MTARRMYNDGCAAAHALDLVGDRWALLVVRELLLGQKRFTDLRAGMPGVSSNVLTQRLRDLEENGVVYRRKLGPPVAAWVYGLTPWGRDLEPILLHLGRWGTRSPWLDRDAGRSADSLMLGQRALFDPELSGDLNATYALHLGEDEFEVRVADGHIEITRGEAAAPDAVLETDVQTFATLMGGRATLKEATESGRLKLAGSAEAVERWLGSLMRPEPASSGESSPALAHG